MGKDLYFLISAQSNEFTNVMKSVNCYVGL